MSIARWEFEHARQFPDQIGLIFGDRAWTNAELHARARRFAAALLGLGVGPGDRVALALENSPELFIACSGAVIAGATMVVLGDRFSSELQSRIEHCEPRVLVCASNVSRALAGVRRDTTIVAAGDLTSAGVLRFDDLIARAEPLVDFVRVPDSTPVQLCYTSGSTGRPKAVPYTHGGLDRFLQSFAEMPDRQAPTTILLCAPPTAFVSRLITLRVLANNRYVVLPQFDPERTLGAVERYRVQQMSLLPTMAEQLVTCSARTRFDCSSLRSINIGGAHVPAALVARLRKLAGEETSVRVLVQYGMTEAGGGIAATTEGGDGLVGPLMPGVVVRIGTSDGTDARPGEVGEVIARTPYGPQGYWRDSEQSARVFRGGFVHTGDLGYFRDDGQLCLVGRSKDVIIQGGVKICPSELVSVIYGIPGVRECAAVGCANEVLGEEVVVCVARAPGFEVSESRIRMECRMALDPSRQPVRILFFDELPRKEGGKVDLQALRRRASIGARGQQARSVLLTEARQIVERELRAILMDELLPADRAAPLDPHSPFGELGLTSQGAVRLAHALQERLGRDVPSTLAYSCPTIAACAEWIATAPSVPVIVDAATTGESTGRQPIAIVGIGVRLPGGASTPDELWDLLWNERETVGEVPGDRRSSGGPPWRAAFLPNVADFDAGFFRLSAEAAEIDPRHRQLLEVCWEAFENAGLDPTALCRERTGVFLGLSGERYRTRSPLGAAIGMAAGYLCHFFDIRGPVVTLDTTCSSSLAALHQAVESLHRRECDLAIVGSANLLVEPREDDPLGVMSRDGRTRAFDAEASGFGPGEGTLVLVLRRLDDAGRAGDRTYACVLGSAVNHDGRSSSLTAPNPQAQAKVITLALEAAGVEASRVQYVEAHGTGTPLGDPIEVDGLFRSLGSARRVPLAIGSVKSNIGHLEAAAGLAGVVKVALAIAQRRLPASRHCTSPNPRIAWEHVPVRVQSSRGEWPEPHERLIAGVSSFGMSGTNAHAVLAEPPPRAAPVQQPSDSRADSEGRWLLPISARTETALRAAVSRWIGVLEQGEQTASCRDIAYAASCRRAHLPFRVVANGSSRQEWVARLREYLVKRAKPWKGASPGETKLVLVFSGQGSQWNGMARQLLREELAFAHALTRAAALIEARSGWNVIDELQREDADSRLDSTEVTQPVLFAVQVALFELWKSWGVDAAAAVGHSAGEVAAAYAAGALSLEESVQVICERARVCGEAPRGAMLAVSASLAEAQELCAQLPVQLEIAAINGPRSVVLSGSVQAVEEAGRILRSRGMKAVALPGTRAFHSRYMETAATALRAAVVTPPPRRTQMLLISGMTAASIEQLDGDYWSRQLLEPVRFSDAIQALLQDGCTAFLEVGPHPVLLPAIYEVVQHHATDALAVGSLRRGSGGVEPLLDSLGMLYCAGIPIDWKRRFASAGPHVDLPRYPWEHQRYWHDSVPVRATAQGNPAPVICLDERRAAASSTPEALVREALSDLIDAPVENLRPHHSLHELGLDSLALIRLGTRLSSLTGRPAMVSKPETTLAELMDALVSPTTRRSSPLTWLRRGGAEPAYVWIHPGGGGIDCYRPLAECLACRSIAIDSADLLLGTSSDSSVEQLATDYLGYLDQEGVNEPLVLAGWSFGGVVAFEMALQLERRGRRVIEVILIDSYAGRALPAHWQDPPSELAHVRRTRQAHIRALQRYRPARFRGPLLSLRAIPCEGDPDEIWREAAPDLRVIRVRADHYSIMSMAAKELSHAPQLHRAGE